MELRKAFRSASCAQTDFPPHVFAPVALDVLQVQRKISCRLGPCAAFLFRSDLHRVRRVAKRQHSLEFVLSGLRAHRARVLADLEPTFPAPRVIRVGKPGSNWTAARRFMCEPVLARDLTYLATIRSFWKILRLQMSRGAPVDAVFAQYVSLRKRLLHPTTLQTFIGSQVVATQADKTARTTQGRLTDV